VNSIAISPDGKRVVSGSDDKLVKMWNAETGAEVSSFVGVRWGWLGDGVVW
jgi:WD40 repeat protein